MILSLGGLPRKVTQSETYILEMSTEGPDMMPGKSGPGFGAGLGEVTYSLRKLLDAGQKSRTNDSIMHHPIHNTG